MLILRQQKHDLFPCSKCGTKRSTRRTRKRQTSGAVIPAKSLTTGTQININSTLTSTYLWQIQHCHGHLHNIFVTDIKTTNVTTCARITRGPGFLSSAAAPPFRSGEKRGGRGPGLEPLVLFSVRL